MNLIPQLSRGNPDNFTLHLDFGAVAGMGLVTADAVSVAFEAAWALLLPIGPDPNTTVMRLTTEYPGVAGPWSSVGLRPGEYASVRFVPNLPWRAGGTVGGTTTQKLDRNPSLYLPNESYVVVASPAWMGRAAVHEFGHLALMSWPTDETQHSPDPSNVMFGGQLAESPTWTPRQIISLLTNLNRVRSGVRLGGRVEDGGRPAWPVAHG